MEVHKPRLAIQDFTMPLIILDMSNYSKLFSNIEALSTTSALQKPVFEFEFWHTIY